MWFTLALLAGLLFAINRLLIRSTLTRGGNPVAFMAVHNGIAGILLLPVALYYFNPPSNLENWSLLLLSTFTYFLVDLFTFLSLRTVEASVFQIIAQLRHIVVLAGAYFLFSERVTSSKVIAIVLLVVGVAIAALGKTGIKPTKDVIYAIQSAAFIGFAFLLTKLLADDVSIAFLASFGFIGCSVLAFLTLAIRNDIPKRLLPTKPTKLLVAGAIFAVFELVFFAALATGEASKVTPVQQSAMVFSLIGGYIFLNERQRLKQKLIGSVLIALSIGLLYFF